MDKIPRDLRFKLELIAYRHKVKVKGYSLFEIIRRIIDTSNNLTEKEKNVLRKVAEFYGEDINDMFRRQS